jgi:hypothetical protein
MSTAVPNAWFDHSVPHDVANCVRRQHNETAALTRANNAGFDDSMSVNTLFNCVMNAA